MLPGESVSDHAPENKPARYRWEFSAHLRALRSATITSADAPSRTAWHHAIQHPLRRATDGILRATASAAFIMTGTGGSEDKPETSSWASVTVDLHPLPSSPAASPPPTRQQSVTSQLGVKGASVY